MNDLNSFGTVTVMMAKGHKKMGLNFIDLFAGAGGLSCGLERAGLNCILGVDFDRAAMETFKRNHPNAEVFVGDIAKLDDETALRLTKNREVDLVCGGPPCQGLSTVGKGIPNDPRNLLFLQFVRLVKLFSPKYIMLENVTGLLGKKNRNILNGIMSEFEKLGYHLDVQVLSAHHYGAPQKRRRTIFIGNRMGYANIFPEIMFDAHDACLPPAKTVGDAFKSLGMGDGGTHNHDVGGASIPEGTEREIIRRIPEGRYIRYESDELELLPKELHLGVDWRTIQEGRLRQAKYRRLHRDEPSPTIMTDGHTYYHPIEDRFITVREGAAIQGFPNDFVFEGTVSQQWRQVGNAVPPPLAEAIGKAILKMELEKNGTIPRTKDLEGIRSHAFNYKTKSNTNRGQQKLLVR
ncbi:MAG: DNA cytosine methyltransferase [Candidatus Diapherotrites archaeon]